jgi:hypothetical protein
VTTFDELIGAEPTGAERERLRSVHELLLEAGPPAELAPEIASGPTLAMTFGRIRRMKRPRRMLIPAAAAAALLALIIGISTNKGDHGLVIPLQGTAAAPTAAGTLDVIRPKTMRIDVRGLARGTYGVYLVSNSRPTLECGSFVVSNTNVDTTATLTSHYRLHAHDTWVVTRLDDAVDPPGVTVLRPLTSTT